MNEEERNRAIATIFATLWPDMGYRVNHWHDRSDASSNDNFILLVPAKKTVVGPIVRIHEKREIIVTWYSQQIQQSGFVKGKTAQEVIEKVREVGL